MMIEIDWFWLAPSGAIGLLVFVNWLADKINNWVIRSTEKEIAEFSRKEKEKFLKRHDRSEKKEKQSDDTYGRYDGFASMTSLYDDIDVQPGDHRMCSGSSFGGSSS